MQQKQRAVQIQQYGEPLKCVQNVEVPKILGPKQLLVKIKAAPINPSDIGFSLGNYAIKHELPTIVGLEGAGQVVQVGEQCDQTLLNKNVSCWASSDINSGTWADYFVAQEENVLVINESNPDFTQYCSAHINPFTVVGFLDLAERTNADSVLLNAGNSALAKMAIRLFAIKNIATTILVRKDEQIQEILQLGARTVINENLGEQGLQQVFQENKIKIFFDCVGGEQTGKIIKILPNGAQTICYGRLSKQPIGQIDPVDLIFKRKSLNGFWLTHWYQNECSSSKREEVKKLVQTHWLQIFQTKIYKQFAIEDVADAVKLQLEVGGGQGKIVLTFN